MSNEVIAAFAYTLSADDSAVILAAVEFAELFEEQPEQWEIDAAFIRRANLEE